MLHAMSTNTEESQLVLSHLLQNGSNGSEDGNNSSSASEQFEEDFDNVKSVCARYGSIRRIERVPGGASIDEVISRDASQAEDTSIVVEYINIQDARLAASELSANSAQLFGAGVTVKVAPLAKHKQASCRQLLASLSRWRTELAATQMQQQAQQQYHQQAQQNTMMQGMLPNSIPMNMPVNAMMYQQQAQQQYPGAIGMYPHDIQAAMQANQAAQAAAGQMPYMNYNAGKSGMPSHNMSYYQPDPPMMAAGRG